MIASHYFESQVLQIDSRVYPFIDLTERIIATKKFMESHFSEKISLRALAEQACISEFHFIRVFRNYYGRTPHQYLISIRIREAEKMLAAGVPVKDTCSSCGFENIGWFTEVFRKSMGMPPATFRRKKIESPAKSLQNKPALYP